MFFSYFRFTFWAWMLIVLGALALLTNLGWINSDIWRYWPILVIFGGIYLLAVQKKRKKIVFHHFLERLATDERVQDKLAKIIDTVDEVVDKKLDDWHKETTQKRSKKDEDIGGEQEG